MAMNEQELIKSITSGIIDGLKAMGFTPKSIEEQERQAKKEDDAKLADQRKHTVDQMYAAISQRNKDTFARIAKTDHHEGLGLRFARAVRAHSAARLDGVDVRSVAKDWGDADLEKDLDQAHSEMRAKALAAGSGQSAGGAIIPPGYVAELIELLRAETVVRKAGARQIPMPNGTMNLPRQTGAGTAGYGAELQNISPSQQTFDGLNFASRKLTALTPISNDLIRLSDPAVDLIVRDDLLSIVSLREDLAFLRGDGTQNSPRGLRNLLATGNIFQITHAGAVATVAEVNGDLHDVMYRVKSRNVKIRRPAWFFSTRVESWLMSLRDTGEWFVRDEVQNGRLFGVPFYISNQLPENLDVSGSAANDETEVYFQEMSEFIIADELDMRLEVFPNGTYHDGSALRSGISTDETVARVIAKHDCNVRHDVSGSILTAVDWAP